MPTCRIADFAEMVADGTSLKYVRSSIGSNAANGDYEIRVTLLSADADPDFTSDPVYIHSRLFLSNFNTNTWLGNFISTNNVGQSGFCQDTCQIEQYSADGDDLTGDAFQAQIEIVPVMVPCDGCSIACDGDFSVATAGCSANPGGSNCATITYTTVAGDLAGSCTASGGANKIRLKLLNSAGIHCNQNCNEQFRVDGNYLLALRNPGLAYDDWLSTGTTVTFNFDSDFAGGTMFTIEVMAVT